MNSTKLVIAAAMFATAAAQAQQITVFGLPLGGKLVPAPRQCPNDFNKRTQLCWIAKPSGKGGHAGMASIPETALPQWAAHSSPDISVNSAGELESVHFRSLDHDGWLKAVQSIRGRFGPPTNADSRSGTTWAIWDTTDIYVRTGCASSSCMVTFMSRAAYEASEKRRAAAQAARPATP
jgi:hypothetical protein